MGNHAVKRYFVAGLTLCVLALLLPLHLKKNGALWGKLADAGHVPLFFVVTIAIYFLLSSKKDQGDMTMIRTVFMVWLGILFFELLQPLVGREGSVVDLENGVLGSGFAAIGLFVWKRALNFRWHGPYLGLGIVSLVVVLLPVVDEWELMKWAHAQFPLLGDFETGIELTRWQPIVWSEQEKTEIFVSQKHFTHGKKSLKLQTASDSWSGVSFRANGGDWSNYQFLSFDVFNPGTEFELHLRVDDFGNTKRYQDRFNRVVSIAPGSNTVQISINEIRLGPVGRELEINCLKEIYFFTRGVKRVFYLDNLRLEEKKKS